MISLYGVFSLIILKNNSEDNSLMFALVDCNNFYCSCERVFNPALRMAPVVVLSNNDGCIIARSNEAKAMGIAMGTPFYQVRAMLSRNKVAVFSSNYTLYGDMSRRVMMLLSEFTPDVCQYSIDEAFVDLSGFGQGDSLHEYGRTIVRKIGKGTGIPVTIGIASTKTLAKVASKYGKRFKAYEGVCIIDDEIKRIKALKGIDVSDIWGIGRRSVSKLNYYGVHTAYDLTQCSESWVRRVLTVSGVRTWRELRGESCIDIEDMTQKKSICTSRSFAGNGLSEISQVEEAVANFASSCSYKLKQQHSCCNAVTVFAYTSRFRTDMPRQVINHTSVLRVPTNDLRELVSMSVEALRSDWPTDMCYFKKAGVIVWDICPDNAVQTYLFDKIDRAKQARLAAAIDSINRKNGYGMVKVAVQGTNKDWHLKHEYASKKFTTDLNEIIKVKI